MQPALLEAVPRVAPSGRLKESTMVARTFRSSVATRALPFLTAATLAACATNPATGKKEFSLMSEAQEIQLGQQMDGEVRREMGLYDDPELQRYVESIGMRLARNSQRPNLPWHFTVVDAPAVNAFALPGGYIYLTRGILPFLNDEAQLAGVLGHEIGHVTARHSAQQYTKATSAGIGVTLLSIFVPEARPLQGLTETALGVLFLKYGRDDELQADSLGVDYAAKSGWDPAGVAGMLTTLSRLDEASGSRKGVPNWLSTHPAPADRVQKVRAAVQQASASMTARTETDRSEYLRRIDGIVFGDSPSEGIVRGNTFLHPDLRLALTFPQGWEVQNTKTQVVAKAPERENYMLLQLVPNASGSVEQIARTTMANSGFRQLNGERAEINGLDAYVGTYQGQMQGLGNVGTLAAHIVHERNVYVLAGLAPANQFQGVERQFVAAIRSFRSLSRAEAAEIKPNRVDVYTVRNGDTWQEIAERVTRNTIKPTTLAIMNNYDPSQPPRPGDRIKVVVEG
ncbi:MAG: M48 family metalloprotease [Acidobacteria bacterium]|nr:M48 family metalloprotease [Acidobacteriota bacterium]